MTAPYEGSTPPEGNIPPQGGTPPTGTAYPGASHYPGESSYAQADLAGATDPSDLTRPFYGATFPIAAKRFFKKYATFSGRASRSEFWWAQLMGVLIGLIPGLLVLIGVIQSLAQSPTTTSGTSSSVGTSYYSSTPDVSSSPLFVIGMILCVVVFFALVIPQLAITWRRLHDGNFSGAFWLLSFIPSIGGLVVLILTLLPSRAEGRRFDVA